MKIFTQLIVLAALLWLGFILFQEGRAQQAVENTDQTKIVLFFVGTILVALVAGTIVALSVVPAMGDWVANIFVNPNEEIEHDRHMDAQAKIAQGDYEGAIKIFLEIFANDSSDMHALSEAAKLFSDKLGDPDSAAGLLENALQQEWPPEESAFFANRLVDIYWNHRADADNSCALLRQIAETMPGTKFAANALHRIHEIERAVMTGHLPTSPGVDAEG